MAGRRCMYNRDLATGKQTYGLHTLLTRGMTEYYMPIFPPGSNVAPSSLFKN